MKRKVYWTADEKSAIHDKLVKLFAIKPHLTKHKALSMAQQVLPKDRWRKITPTVGWKLAEFIQSARNASTVNLISPYTSDIPFLSPTASGVSGKDDIESVLDRVADAMAEKIMQRVQDKLANSLQGSNDLFDFSVNKFGA